MSDSILEVQGLSKRFGKRLAVNELSFSVQRGEICGFLGRNGAGKSTTIRMILGLIRPTAGEISLNGTRLSSGRHPSSWPVGAIVESPAFYDYLPARKNLELLSSLSGGAERGRIDEILELVGLTERQHENVSVYSHGMRQRLGLAQALLPNPELVILDEPLDGLDPNGIRAMRDIMLNVVRDRGVTIFLSSHNLVEVELTCNRVVVINKGVRIYQGPTGDLVADSRVVRFRAAPGGSTEGILRSLDFIEKFEPSGDHWNLHLDHARVPELARALVASGVDVLELTPMKNSLEDVFIGLTESAGIAEVH